MTFQPRLTDPVGLHTRPPFPEQDQDHPGSTAAMDPRPDHGEDIYQGHGLLHGRKRWSPGDSEIGSAVCQVFAREGADVVFTHFPDEADEAGSPPD
ncbi:hypothetical protein ACFV2S_06145 [Streptomyces sp. NPDC059695]|uniref:hypothetical protein n=1 Tax=Streptomyces sp. NPDC059695 TaxID=3346910 RepID=UPI0036BFEFBF